MLLIALLLAAVSNRVLLFEETVRIPRSQWRAVTVSLKQRPATIDCEYKVVRGRSGVRVALMRREDVERLRRGQSHRVLATTDYESEGRFRHTAGLPGDYMLLLDNRLESGGGALLQVRVTLEFNEMTSFEPAVLPPERRTRVVLTSLLLFALAAALSGRGLLRALRRRDAG